MHPSPDSTSRSSGGVQGPSSLSPPGGVNSAGRRRRPLVRLLAIVAAIAIALSAGAMPAAANVRIDDTPVPFYARISGPAVVGGDGQVLHTDEWAAIPFYRPPECVPADFNLLDFFDIPGAFACGPQTVQTATVWRNGPETDEGPIHARSFGLGAVPVWFVSLPELEAAIADGELTIGELGALPSLILGEATFYSETLHPLPFAQNDRLVIVARGSLEDGRTFQLQAVASLDLLTHVRIAFR